MTNEGSATAFGSAPSAPDRILQATSNLLARKDTLKFSLAEVAAEAGLNHGLVGYYFGGKDGLLLALFKRDAEIALASVEKLVRSDLDPLSKLRKHIQGVIETYSRHPYLNRLINSIQENETTSPKEIWELFVDPLKNLQGNIFSEIESCLSGIKVDRDIIYFIIIGSCTLPFQSRNIYSSNIADRESRNEFTNWLANGIADFITQGIKGCANVAHSQNS